MRYVACFIFLLICTSCWRMPKEGEVSTIPATNNPSVIHQSSSGSWSPSVDY